MTTSKATLITSFQSGDVPSGSDFAALINSYPTYYVVSGSAALSSLSPIESDIAYTQDTCALYAYGAAWHPVSASGAGGASTSDHFIVGQGGQNDTDLSNKVIIPGLSGHPDIRVAGANDDEFDTTDTTDPITGWSTLGTLDTLNANSDFLSNLHLGRTATGNNLDGIYKAMSASFTMTAKLNDMYMLGNANYPHVGLFVAEASPGKIDSFGMFFIPGTGLFLRQTAWTDRTAQASYNQPTTFAAPAAKFPMYIRIVVRSSSDIDYSISNGGYIFSEAYNGDPFRNHNPNFTIGAAGLYVCGINNGTKAAGAFDWVRFT